ncbi:unnamed protein product [Ambrosiozyma monospora]|uniref:Unnamed protein product n=1 Tax=Ambrosiozyma monospora TaxID=43982 RepID=A0ACB5TQP2_AMBMO|nr:unnamed protein product [Ambrosiozyma monospora]
MNYSLHISFLLLISQFAESLPTPTSSTSTSITSTTETNNETPTPILSLWKTTFNSLKSQHPALIRRSWTPSEIGLTVFSVMMGLIVVLGPLACIWFCCGSPNTKSERDERRIDFDQGYREWISEHPVANETRANESTSATKTVPSNDRPVRLDPPPRAYLEDSLLVGENRPFRVEPSPPYRPASTEKH